MSSTVLYLAIVAVWAIVLVPMWLRRDTETTGISRILHKRPEDDEEEETPAEDVPQPHRRVTRATIIARRRRRTAGLTLLVLTAVVVVVSGVAPWWVMLLPAALLAGHLTLLRVAAGMDTARRRASRARAAARARAREARRAAATTEPAEVIDLVAPDEVFDQYADDRRAVGE